MSAFGREKGSLKRSMDAAARIAGKVDAAEATKRAKGDHLSVLYKALEAQFEAIPSKHHNVSSSVYDCKGGHRCSRLAHSDDTVLPLTSTPYYKTVLRQCKQDRPTSKN